MLARSSTYLLRIERFDNTKRKYILHAMKKTICEIFQNHALKITVTHTVRLRAMRNTNKKKLKPPSALGYLITVNFDDNFI